MENKKNGLAGKIFSYGGSYFGAVVGAGFASGQEVMQFYTNYGVMSMIAILVAMVIFIWIGTRFAAYGNESRTYGKGYRVRDRGDILFLIYYKNPVFHYYHIFSSNRNE